MNENENNVGFENLNQNKKGNKALIIILVITIICLLGFSGYMTYKYIINPENNNQSNNNSTNSNNNNNTVAEETKVTDPSIKNILKRNYDVITFAKGYNLNKDYEIEGLFENNVTDKVSDNSILYNSINNAERVSIDDTFKNDYKSKEKGLSEYSKKFFDNFDDMNTYYYVKEESLAKIVKEVFDKDYSNMKHDDIGINYKNADDYTMECPSYLYDSVNKIYFIQEECGGFAGFKSLEYIYDYTYKNNEYYVYTAVGSIGYSGDKETVYTSYRNNSTLNESIEEINSSNYDKFDHFRLVFEKNSDGNYIFKKVELVEK